MSESIPAQRAFFASPLYYNKKPWKAPPFPHIIEIKLVNIFMYPKIMQKCSMLYVIALETSGKRPFPF